MCAWAGLFALFPGMAAAAEGVPRLGNDVAPISYDLAVTPQLKTMLTDGDETIRIAVTKRVDHIVLNWLGVSISNVTIDGSPALAESHAALQQVWLRPASEIQPGTHDIHLSFISRINNGIEAAGFWNDQTRKAGISSFLVTMFEPSTARMMFPCFDEPGFRAAFTLHVTAPSDWTVVSNMPATARTQLDAATARTDFAATPPMPTYLLTVDAGVMSSVAGASDGVPIHVYAVPGTAGLATILSRAETILHYYDWYLGIPFPLPKLDVIAAPGSYHSALEQWGAMTFYSAQDITSGSNGDPVVGERQAFDELSHEMGHQWFGDLVGMRWWRDTFVAEGVTQWFAYGADRALEPALPWYRDQDSGIDSVMGNGIGAKTSPVISNIETDYEKDDWAAFGLATYDKGAAVLEMWRSYIGNSVFRAALKRYLQRNAGTAVSFEQFWSAFDDPAAEKFGAAWLKRPGFPVVTVSLRCNRQRQSAIVTQSPFLSGLGSPPGYTAQIWPLPIVLRSGTASPHTYLLQSRSFQFPAGNCGENAAVNQGSRPYYRVRYADAARAEKALFGANERDRSNAVRDSVALTIAGIAPADYFLRLAPLIHATDEPQMIRQAAFLLASTFDALPPGRERDAVADIARRTLGQMIRDVPVTLGNGQPQPYTAALSVLAAIGYPEFSATAQQRLDAMNLQKTRSVFDVLMAWIAAAGADDARVSAMEAQLKKNPPQRIRYGYVLENEPFAYLTHVGSPVLARRIFTDYISDPDIFFSLARRHPDIAWPLLQAHTRELLSRIVPSQRAWFLTTEVSQTFWFLPQSELRAYFERELGPFSERSIHVAMQDVVKRQQAAAKIAAEVRRYLSAPPCATLCL